MEEVALIVFKMKQQFKISAAAHKNVKIPSFVLPWNFCFEVFFIFVFYFHTKAMLIFFCLFVISVSYNISRNIIINTFQQHPCHNISS